MWITSEHMPVVEWPRLSKVCLICAQKKPLNDFYSRNDRITIRLRPYIVNWLEIYLETKTEVLRGLSSLQGDTLDKIPREELLRDIEILSGILKVIKDRSNKYMGYEIDLLNYISEQEQQDRRPEFSLGIEHIDQLGHILANEYKHMRSHDDTYQADNNKSLRMIYAILVLIEKQALESRDDVCIDCLKLYHKPIHTTEECLVCCRWEWYDNNGMCDGTKVITFDDLKNFLDGLIFSSLTKFLG